MRLHLYSEVTHQDVLLAFQVVPGVRVDDFSFGHKIQPVGKRESRLDSGATHGKHCFSIDIPLTRGQILAGLEVQEKIRKME